MVGQTCNGSPAEGTFVISGDSATFSRFERIPIKNVTSSVTGKCTRGHDAGALDAGDGSVGSD